MADQPAKKQGKRSDPSRKARESLHNGAAGAKADGPLLATKVQLAEALALHRNTIAKIIKENDIEPVTRRNGREVFSVRQVLDATRRNASGEVNLDQLSAFERDAMTRSLQREDEIRRRRRELLDSAEVEEELAWFTRTVAHELETLPDVIERQTGHDGHIIELAEQAVNRIRVTLYERLTQWKEKPGNER